MQSLAEATERRVSTHQHRIERWARSLGHPRTLLLLILGVSTWIIINATARAPLDPPPFFWLQGSLALYAATPNPRVSLYENAPGNGGESSDTQ